MKASLMVVVLGALFVGCGPDLTDVSADVEGGEAVTQQLGEACYITVKNPYRSSSYVYGEASVSCSLRMNIDLTVTLKGPNGRSSMTRCYGTTYCPFRIPAPYASGYWQTTASASSITTVAPIITWSGSKPSSWIRL
jgi:hypothetical protein